MNENLIIFLFILIYFSPVFYQLYLAIRESKRGNKFYLHRVKRFLKWGFIILLPIIGIIAILSHTNYIDYEEPIPYNKIDKITFENFRGIELFKKSLYGNERFAYVYTTIEKDFEADSLMIKSLFHPSRSFVYKKNNNSQELLDHELFHFKITELFVRQIKQEISRLERPSTHKIEEIVHYFEVRERKFQQEYDYDTFHSYVYGEQKRYEKLIDSSLNSLKKFTHPKIYINEID